MKDKQRKINHRRLAQIIVAYLGGCAAIQVASAQSLMEIYLKARQNDTQYNAARRLRDAGEEKRTQGLAGLLPNVNVVGGKNQQMGDASFSDAPYEHRDVSSWNWSLQVTQPLVRWGNVAAYAQGNAQTLQAQEQFSLAEHELILRVAQAYFDFHVAQEGVQVARAQELAIGEQLTLAERTYSVGTGTVTDVHESKAKHALAKAQYVAAENDVVIKQVELEKLVGETLTPAPMRLMQDLPAVQGGVDQWLTAAVSGNPQIRIQQAALDVAHQEVNKSYAAHAPTLDLVFNKGGSYSSGSMSSPADLATRVDSFQRGIQFNIPLFAGGATQSKAREALALEEKARDDLLGAQRQASSAVRQAYAGVVSSQAQVTALEAAVEAGRNSVASNKIGFTIGTRINPDVLNAEQQLYSAMRDLSKARAEAAMQGLKLKSSVGALSSDDLQALDQLLLAASTASGSTRFQPYSIVSTDVADSGEPSRSKRKEENHDARTR